MIALERLMMLALGELGEVEAAEIDEHILACTACAATFERLLRVGPCVRDAVAAGTIGFPVSGALVDQLSAAGLVSRSYRLRPDDRVPCTAGAQDIYALTTLEADLQGVARVDIVRTTPLGLTRMQDVPFDAALGVVMYVTRSDQLRKLPSCRIRIELVIVDESGERTGAQYLLEHTAFAGA
jgi:hypothetical protein